MNRLKIALVMALAFAQPLLAQTAEISTMAVGSSATRNSTFYRVDTSNPTTHTHAVQVPLSVMFAGNIQTADIAQSGAATGQVLEWSGTAWAPATLPTGTGGGSYTLTGATPTMIGGVLAGTAPAHRYLSSIDPTGGTGALIWSAVNANDIATGSATSGQVLTIVGGTSSWATLPAGSGVTDAAALHYRGAWAASTAYLANDVVQQANLLYEAPSAFTSGSTFSGSNWTQLTYAASGSGTGTPTTRTLYTASATWTPPSSGWARITAYGGGASGASGCVVTTGVPWSAGAGGTGGHITTYGWVPVSSLSGSYIISIAAPAAAVTAACTAGNPGGAASIVGTNLNVVANGAGASSTATGGAGNVASASGDTGSANLASATADSASAATPGACPAAAIGCVSGSAANGNNGTNYALYTPGLSAPGGGVSAAGGTAGSGFAGGNAIDGCAGGGAGQGFAASDTTGRGAPGGSTSTEAGGAAGLAAGAGGNGIQTASKGTGSGGGGGGSGANGGAGGNGGGCAGGGGGGDALPGGIPGNGGAGGTPSILIEIAS